MLYKLDMLCTQIAVRPYGLIKPVRSMKYTREQAYTKRNVARFQCLKEHMNLTSRALFFTRLGTFKVELRNTLCMLLDY